MWVSTGKAGVLKAWMRTTEAVLCPTPGRASRSCKVLGTWELCCETRILERLEMAEALRLERPQGLMIFCMTSMGRVAMDWGVSARAKRWGVTWLTRLSVHWAERRTEMRRVNGSLWVRGMGGLG